MGSVSHKSSYKGRREAEESQGRETMQEAEAECPDTIRPGSAVAVCEDEEATSQGMQQASRNRKAEELNSSPAC